MTALGPDPACGNGGRLVNEELSDGLCGAEPAPARGCSLMLTGTRPAPRSLATACRCCACRPAFPSRRGRDCLRRRAGSWRLAAACASQTDRASPATPRSVGRESWVGSAGGLLGSTQHQGLGRGGGVPLAWSRLWLAWPLALRRDPTHPALARWVPSLKPAQPPESPVSVSGAACSCLACGDRVEGRQRW